MWHQYDTVILYHTNIQSTAVIAPPTPPASDVSRTVTTGCVKSRQLSSIRKKSNVKDSNILGIYWDLLGYALVKVVYQTPVRKITLVTRCYSYNNDLFPQNGPSRRRWALRCSMGTCASWCMRNLSPCVGVDHDITFWRKRNFLHRTSQIVWR